MHLNQSLLYPTACKRAIIAPMLAESRRLTSECGTRPNILCALAEKVGPMNRFRLILWTVAMGYSGFLIAGRGTRSFDTNTIYEALIGALLGVLLAVLFTRRARRKRI
jgi:hypothetical protein